MTGFFVLSNPSRSGFYGRRVSPSQESQPSAWLCMVVAEGPFVIPPWAPGQVFPGGGGFVHGGARASSLAEAPPSYPSLNSG